MSSDGTRNQAPTGRIFIVSGPSGAGKSTLCRHLRAQLPHLNYSISYTTRSPRRGEKDGRDYHFITADIFRERIEDGGWAEWARVHDHFYGSSARFIDGNICAGRPVLLEIDVQGALQIKRRYPDSITIFIAPPSMTVLRQRLTERSTDSKDIITRRLAAAQVEMQQAHRYRHVIVNDDLDRARQALVSIVLSYSDATY